MLGPFKRKIFIWYEYAIGVRFSFVVGKVGHQFDIPLDIALGLLTGDKVIAWYGFVRIDGTYHTGNNI